MTITQIPISIVYTIIEMINRHDYDEEVIIDGEFIPRKHGTAPYAGKPFQKLQIRLFNRTYCIENGIAYLHEPNDTEE